MRRRRQYARYFLWMLAAALTGSTMMLSGCNALSSNSAAPGSYVIQVTSTRDHNRPYAHREPARKGEPVMHAGKRWMRRTNVWAGVALLALAGWWGPAAAAQVEPAAVGGEQLVAVGGMVSAFHIDYGKRWLGGEGVYGGCQHQSPAGD